MDMEQKVEQRAKALQLLYWNEQKSGWWDRTTGAAREQYRRIARAELEREGRLVEALGRARNFMVGYQATSTDTYSGIVEAVAAYEAEFAPPVRTVEQIARDVVSKHTFEDGGRFIAVPVSLMDELAAALGKDGK